MIFPYSQRIKILLCLFICALLMIGGPELCFGQTSQRGKLEKSKKELEEEINYTSKLLSQTKKNRQKSVNQLVILNNQIQKRERLINTINDQVENIHGQINSNQSNLLSLQKNLQKLKKEYGTMIYQAFLNRSAYNRLMFIFAASDFNQAYQRLRYFQQYSKFRKNQINKILGTQKKINLSIAQLEGQRNDKLQLVNSKEKEKQKLTSEKKEKDLTVSQLKQQEKKLKSRLKEKEAALRKLQSAIEAIIAEEMRKSAGPEKGKADKSGPVTSYTLTPEEKELSSSFSANRGRLPWPTEKGIISSTFGEHEHPVLKGIRTKNNGINIITASGASARAVFNGTVSAVMSIPNLNKVVIVRHGNYLSVYSNLSSVSVSKGDKVKTKQFIGAIVTDTEDSKTELHFEIWEGTRLLDPENWLAR